MRFKRNCAHTYRPGRAICFITDGPKPREVFAADFRDRVVHHLLAAYQERVFEPIFLHDCYACRKGKGTLAASDQLMTFLRQVTANGRRGGGGPSPTASSVIGLRRGGGSGRLKPSRGT